MQIPIWRFGVMGGPPISPWKEPPWYHGWVFSLPTVLCASGSQRHSSQPQSQHDHNPQFQSLVSLTLPSPGLWFQGKPGSVNFYFENLFDLERLHCMFWQQNSAFSFIRLKSEGSWLGYLGWKMQGRWGALLYRYTHFNLVFLWVC